MKSLNLDIIVSPEVGLIILITGFFLLIYGYKQGKKQFDFDKFPIIKPVLKELTGICLIIFGIIQMLPSIFNYF